MRVLLIGGTNFIGPVVAAELEAAGHDVTLFHRRPDPDTPYAQVQGDCIAPQALRQGIERTAPDVIIHMVAYAEEAVRALEQALEGRPTRTVVLSSADVYRAYEVLACLSGVPKQPVPLAEDAPLRQQLYPYRGRLDTPFAHSYEKILVEKAALESPVLQAVVLRLGMVYGTRDPNRRFREPVRQMLAGAGHIDLTEAEAGWRTCKCYVGDVAYGIRLAAERSGGGEVYNLASEWNLTEAEWYRQVSALMDWRGTLRRVDRSPLTDENENLTQHFTLDTGKIRAELGYTEQYTLEEGLAATVAWERAQQAAGL